MTGTATYNLGDGPAHEKFADLDTLSQRATVIGLQEASDRGEVLDDFRRTHRWEVWTSPLPGGKAVPILFDGSAWKARRLRSVLAVGRRFVGPGAGPSHSKPKPINVVILEHLETGDVRRILNTHFIASATRKPEKRFRLRRNHYDAHAHVLARMIGKGARMRRTTVTGDFNAEPDFELLAPVRETGITGWTHEATHGNRNIDHVLGPDGPRDTVRLSSDHRAVVAP